KGFVIPEGKHAVGTLARARLFCRLREWPARSRAGGLHSKLIRNPSPPACGETPLSDLPGLPFFLPGDNSNPEAIGDRIVRRPLLLARRFGIFHRCGAKDPCGSRAGSW